MKKAKHGHKNPRETNPAGRPETRPLPAAASAGKEPLVYTALKVFLSHIKRQFIMAGMLVMALSSLAMALELIAIVIGTFLMSRYFLYTKGSRLYSTRRQSYELMTFALMTTLNVLAGYYILLFGLRVLQAKTALQKTGLAAAATLIPAFVALQLTEKLSFPNPVMAALPPIAAFVLGCAAALRVPEAENPFNKIDLD